MLKILILFFYSLSMQTS